MSKDILSSLKGGDLRSIGTSNEAVRRVSKEPGVFGELFAGLLDPDRLVRMRAADAVEKLTREHPNWLQPWKRCLLDDIATRKDKELRWHVAQLLPRLTLTALEKAAAISVLQEYLCDDSSIVRAFSMQALVDLAGDDTKMIEEIRPVIERLTRTGTAAMKARGRKLLVKLDKRGGRSEIKTPRRHGRAKRDSS